MLAIYLLRSRLRELYYSSSLFLGIRAAIKLLDAHERTGRWDRTLLEPMVFYRPKRHWFRKTRSRPIPKPSHVGSRAHRTDHHVKDRRTWGGSPTKVVARAHMKDAFFI